MTWETERHDWAQLRACTTAARVPDAILTLRDARTESEADHAYWRIDNIVVVQGTLYEAALATAMVALTVLPRAGDVGRKWLLLLLVELIAGTAHEDLSLSGAADLTTACHREVARGVPQYFSILEHGHGEERQWAVDLLGHCAVNDRSLLDRVIWTFERLLRANIESTSRLHEVTSLWLQDLNEVRATSSGDA